MPSRRPAVECCGFGQVKWRLVLDHDSCSCSLRSREVFGTGSRTGQRVVEVDAEEVVEVDAEVDVEGAVEVDVEVVLADAGVRVADDDKK